MRRWRQGYLQNEILAAGIEGDCSALCGAIKRFQRRGRPSIQPLSLKEQSGRRIALIANEANRWLLISHLPAHLFRYVTKDLFDLHRKNFVDQYPKDFDLCDACHTNKDHARTVTCRCPDMDRAIKQANQFFHTRMNKNNPSHARETKRFELLYKLPYVNDGDITDYCDDEPLFFIYLLPSIFDEHKSTGDSNFDPEEEGYFPQQTCRIIEPVSAEDKLLFVDLMRFLGAFETRNDEAQLILYFRLEHES